MIKSVKKRRRRAWEGDYGQCGLWSWCYLLRRRWRRGPGQRWLSSPTIERRVTVLLLLRYHFPFSIHFQWSNTFAIESVTRFSWCAFVVIKAKWSGHCTLIGALVCANSREIIGLGFWFVYLKFNCDWFFCVQDSVKYTGMVEDCCCDYETVDSVNGEVLHPLLQQLVTTPFFRYFKVWLVCLIKLILYVFPYVKCTKGVKAFHLCRHSLCLNHSENVVVQVW